MEIQMIDKFQKHLDKLGFSQLSPIQKAVYEPLLNGDNIVGIAPTGSGKTLSFILPILEKMIPGNGVQGMIVAPSQELAMQLTNVARTFADLVNLKVTAITGGANVKRQIDQIKNHPDLIVGTPGRIKNLIDDRRLKVSGIRTVILDEADDLLDGTTVDTVRLILKAVSKDAQIGFFSATETSQITSKELEKWFDKPVLRYDVRSIDQTQGTVQHGLLTISNFKKNIMLKRLSEMKSFKGLVFFNNVTGMQKTASWLKHNHVITATLASNQRQTDRKKALMNFRLGRIKMLLSTDVAARGLDIVKLSVVVNYDLPASVNGYFHRVGRTGRMGNPGQIINLGNEHDFRNLRLILANTDIELVPVTYQNRKIVLDDELVTYQTAANTNQEQEVNSTALTMDTNTKHKIITHSDANIESNSRTKHKNKHSKRKGMRHKWKQRSKG